MNHKKKTLKLLDKWITNECCAETDAKLMGEHVEANRICGRIADLTKIKNVVKEL